MNSNDFLDDNNTKEHYKLFTREEYDKIYADCLKFIKDKLAKIS